MDELLELTMHLREITGWGCRDCERALIDMNYDLKLAFTLLEWVHVAVSIKVDGHEATWNDYVDMVKKGELTSMWWKDSYAKIKR